MGICYGAQLIAQQNGGSVEGNEKGEYGRTVVNVNESGILLSDFETSTQQVWMSHFDSITSPPEGAVVTASSDGSPVAVFEEPEKGLFGVQFHPEVHHTPCGQDLLRRFIHDVCGCPNDWNMASVV